MEEDFNKWLFDVVNYVSLRTRKEHTEIYSSLDLTDAKYAFIDGISEIEYSTLI